MSEATEVPMICEDCGGTMTDEDAFSISLGEESVVYWHMEHSGCIASLGERLTIATQRAEAAEAERDALRQEVERLTELAALSGEVFAFAITDSKLPNLETRRQLHDAVNRALATPTEAKP